jgi:3-oxoacyl-[acyl-carrier protein] reductase
LSNNILDLKGRVGLVTGAGQGVGRAVALRFAENNADGVVVNDFRPERAEAVAAEVEKLGVKAIAAQCDVTSFASVTAMFEKARAAFGKVDILVNNAGLYEFLPLDGVTEEHFHKHFDLNVLGLLLTTQEAVRHFGDKGGSIINLSSVVGRNAVPGASVYSATKGAVNSITQALSKELGPKKIRVNGVAPGLVVTEGTAVLGVSDSENDFHKAFVAQTPVGRVGQPHDIATVITFLASDDSAWVSGETWYVAGGYQ